MIGAIAAAGASVRGLAPERNRLLSVNNYHYRRGGAEVVYLEQNRLFEEIGWDVVPFAMRHPRNLPSPHEHHFIEEIEYGARYGPLRSLRNVANVVYSLEARRKLRALLALGRPDIAHVHNIYHHLSPSILPMLKQAGVPVVMSVHDLKLACPAYTMLNKGSVCERCRDGRIHNVVVNRCIKGSLSLSGLVMIETAVHRLLGLYRRNVDLFVVPSRFYIEKLVAWGWPRERFVHVPNFVDLSQFRPGTIETGGFLYVGRLSPEKGLETLIRAAALAGQRVNLVGTGPMENRLRALAAETGADIRFLGFRTGAALHDAIRRCRALVLPSTWYENAPISVIEAYALGRPVIGTRIGGLPEMIREGQTGTIVPAGDCEALAAALVRFARMPDDSLRAMGQAGRNWVETTFSQEAYRERLLDLYATLRRRSR